MGYSRIESGHARLLLMAMEQDFPARMAEWTEDLRQGRMSAEMRGVFVAMGYPVPRQRKVDDVLVAEQATEPPVPAPPPPVEPSPPSPPRKIAPSEDSRGGHSAPRRAEKPEEVVRADDGTVLPIEPFPGFEDELLPWDRGTPVA